MSISHSSSFTTESTVFKNENQVRLEAIAEISEYLGQTVILMDMTPKELSPLVSCPLIYLSVTNFGKSVMQNQLDTT